MKALPVMQHDHLLVRRLKNEEQKTDAGIIVPGAAKDSELGEIVAVGPGRREANATAASPLVEQPYRPGQRFIIGSVPRAITWNGEEFLVLTPECVFALVE